MSIATGPWPPPMQAEATPNFLPAAKLVQQRQDQARVGTQRVAEADGAAAAVALVAVEAELLLTAQVPS